MEINKDTKEFGIVCARFKVDPKLVAAIITVESNWNPWAVRYEPQFFYVQDVEKFAKAQVFSVATEMVLQKCSYGLTQLMGGTARWMGFKDHLTKLLDPELNLEWGIRLLALKTQRYTDVGDVIAAYNAGSARKEAGQYLNQRYVDKVMRIYDEL